MPKRIRGILLLVYTVFFVGFATFLLINSFGYRVNTSKRSIDFNSTVQIKTAPFRADITIKNSSVTATTPSDLNISEPGLLDLTISKSGYQSEQISVYYPGGKNANTAIERLYLLPTSPTTSYSLPGKIVAVLSDTLLLVQTDTGLSMVTLSQAGITNVQAIVGRAGVSTDTPYKLDMLSEDIFVDKAKNLLLTKKNDTWQLIGLPSIISNPKSIVGTSSALLVLTEAGQLWSWNYLSPPVYIDSTIRGLIAIKTPKTYWIWKQDWIQKISLNSDISAQILSKNAVFRDPTLLGFKDTKFVIAPVYQGYAVQFGGELLYRPDYNGAKLSVLGSEVDFFSTASDTVYWNTKQAIFFANLRSGTRSLLDNKLPSNVVSVWYDQYWGRLFVVTEGGIYTTWHDNDKDNSGIATYPLTKWTDQLCATEVGGGVAVCAKDTTVDTYINRNILF